MKEHIHDYVQDGSGKNICSTCWNIYVGGVTRMTATPSTGSEELESLKRGIDDIIERVTYHQDPIYSKDFPEDIRYTINREEAKSRTLALITQEMDKAETLTLETVAALLNGDENQVEVARNYIFNKLTVKAQSLKGKSKK